MVRPTRDHVVGKRARLRPHATVQYTRQAVVGVIGRQQPDLVSGLEKLLRERFDVAPDTARVRVGVGRNQGYAHPRHPIGHT